MDLMSVWNFAQPCWTQMSAVYSSQAISCVGQIILITGPRRASTAWAFLISNLERRNPSELSEAISLMGDAIDYLLESSRREGFQLLLVATNTIVGNGPSRSRYRSVQKTKMLERLRARAHQPKRAVAAG